jgi:hypothetical protein
VQVTHLRDLRLLGFEDVVGERADLARLRTLQGQLGHIDGRLVVDHRLEEGILGGFVLAGLRRA